MPASVSRLALATPELRSKVDRRLLRTQGKVSVWITLEAAPVATLKAERLAAQGIDTARRAQAQAVAGGPTEVARVEAAVASVRSELQAHRQSLLGQQNALASQLQSVGASELGRVQLAANAIAVEVDASQLAAIAAWSGVAKIRPVVDVHYEPPAKGRQQAAVAAAAAAVGPYTGKGVRIAVLDSGIDYTHYNLGGAGTAEAYAQAAADATTRRGLFPTAKVVEGHDFVGETWPDDVLRPDSNPLDTSGHGTHVADIAAGRSADGRHIGTAPDADLLAVKVCSSVSTSCSGVATLQGLDYALDPNRDGDISDAVDVVNMSLGASYGQQEDDSMLAASRLERLGVVVVAAAGNDGNRPYIVSSPATAPGAIAVAQTTMRTDTAIPAVIQAPASLRGRYGNTETVDWAPIDRSLSGDVVAVGTSCPEENPVYPDGVAGKIVLIDRGVCAISAKVDVAATQGAIGVLLGMVTEGDTVSFSLGEGTQFVPTLVIAKDLADGIKAALKAGDTVNANLSPDNAVDISGSMVSTSARGPSYDAQSIKPEIGAPGATVSAVAGSGRGNEAFGGTSGATPVVSGAAAMLVQAHPDLRPEQIKALLMNSAERNVYTHKAKRPGVLAPITRIGAGELRAHRAQTLQSVAYVPEARSAALSFGLVEASRNRTLRKTLRIDNLSEAERSYTLQASARYADDTGGAVRLSVPDSVTVPARGSRDVQVVLQVNAALLPDWGLNGGSLGGTGDRLESVEFDGYVTLTSGAETLSVPWHVLPRKAADLGVSARSLRLGESFTLNNAGAGSGGYEVFALTGSNPNVGEVALPGGNQALVDLRAVGARRVAPGYLQFAVNTYGRRAHPAYPAEFDIYLDVDQDGGTDFILYSAELEGFGASGQSAVHVLDAATGETSVEFYLDADLNSANAIFTVSTALLGIPDDTTIGFSVYAYDNYFTGSLTDFIEGMVFNPVRPRWTVAAEPESALAPGASVSLRPVAQAGSASPSQQGFLVMYRQDRDNEADVVRVTR